MLRIALAVALLICGAVPARADPFSFTALLASVFTAALPAGVGTFTIFGVSVATILATVTITAIGVGLSLLLAKRPNAPKGEDGLIPVQQTVPFRAYGYGTVRIAGSIMYKEEVQYQYALVLALFGHKISSIEQIWLNDDPVTLSTIVLKYSGMFDGPLYGRVIALADGRYGNNSVYIDTRYGEDTEPYYKIVAYLDPTNWGSSYRGDGIASLMMACEPSVQKDFMNFFPYGAPIPTSVCNTALVYDPRDETQDVDDPTTWKFTKNVALCLLHFVCFSPYGFRRAYSVAILPVLEYWIRAADDCDEFVNKKVGTERRYQCGFYLTADQDKKVALQTFLAACDGWYCQRGNGTIVLDVGVYRAPVVELHDDQIIGYVIQSDAPNAIRINQSTARYTSPDNGYVQVETNPLIDTADQMTRPGPPRAATLDLNSVQSVGQASRLHKREYIRQQARTRGKIIVRWSALDCCYSRRVLVVSNTIPRLNGKVIEVRKPRILVAEQRCEFEFIQIGEEIDTYDPTTEESPPAVVPARTRSPTLVVPTGLTATAEQITDSAGNATIYIEAQWDQPTAIVQANWYSLRWQIDGSDSWNEQIFQDLTPTASRYTAKTGVVPPESLINVEVAQLGYNGTYSPYCTAVSVDTHIASVAPATPTNFVVTGGSGAIDLSCKNSNSPNFSAVQFYRSAVGAGFSLATPIGAKIYGAPNATSTYTDVVGPGSYDYYVVALNAYDVASTEAGPTTGTAT